ncbi:MAG: hypothetical protein DRH56_00535 [Deltaproteobacteria bacterium]|nr:MAG: hypothetical protein DRH56_00535 [Deltaproteobacteria bacterium]
MRAYLIDEITSVHMEAVRRFLRENAVSSDLDGLFWIKIPKDLLSGTQFAHSGCGPHVFAVEAGTDWVKFELLVRSLANMQCPCAAYATPRQREFIIRFAHGMIAQLDIQT